MHRELAAAVRPRMSLSQTLRAWPEIARHLSEPERRRVRALLI